MAQIWALASLPGQPLMLWLEESGSAPSCSRHVAAYHESNRPAVGQYDSPQPAGEHAPEVWEMWVQDP